MGAAYAVAAWLIIQVVETIFPLFGLGDAPARITVILLAIGFPLCLIFSWVFELTPQGIRKEGDIDRAHTVTDRPGKRLDRIIIVLLAIALGYFAFDRFVLVPERIADVVQKTAQQARSEALVESYSDNSIAVLPFVNMSADPEQDYFSDGISEELLNVLARIPELRVISRSSSFVFKGQKISIPEVASKLNVAYVLEGSVRKAGNRVRITAQLIDASTDTHLWSDTFDHEMVDIFAVQDEIAASISELLRAKLALVPGVTGQLAVPVTSSVDAYEAYLRGRELIRLRSQADLETAIEYLERALRLDETFAPAHAQLAIAIAMTAARPRDKIGRASPHLDRAQELEPELAEAHGGRALLAFQNNELEASIEHARKALAVNPNYVDAMNWLNLALRNLGRYEEADEMQRQLLLTDPLSVIGRFNYAIWLRDHGRTEEAHRVAELLLPDSPDLASLAHADVYAWGQGELAKGLSWALRSSESSRFVMFVFAWVGEFAEARRVNVRYKHLVAAAEGRWEEAIAATQALLNSNPENESAVAEAAKILFLAGRVDQALPLYELLLESSPGAQPIKDWWYPVETMRIALARRLKGDEQGAQSAAQEARQEHAARHAAGIKHWIQDLSRAMIAAFDRDPGLAINSLQSAIQNGLRDRVYLDSPMYAQLRDEPEFAALRSRFDAVLASERDKILQLICFNNPVPDDWQPMPDTCEGVALQSRL